MIAHVRHMIERRRLRPGDRLPSERDLALQIGVSRPSVRAGLKSLVAMGVLESRHGAGTFITSGPPALGSEPLRFLAALHGFRPAEVFEARRVLEVGVAGLAAERGNGEQVAAMAEEVTGMFASLDDPPGFLQHDVRFHLAVAAASGNPILASLVEMVSAVVLERRRETVNRSRDLKEAAEMHRQIYQAIRSRSPDRARAAMDQHLMLAERAQEQEEDG